jgi:hypothetical protein
MNTDQTAILKPGRAIKFKLSGTVYYAIATAVASNLLTIAGAPLTTGAGDLEELYYSPLPDMVETMWIPIPGVFAAAANTTMLASHLNTAIKWNGAPAYLVKISAIVKSVDTGANQPRVNVDIAGANPVSTSNTNAGISPDTSWVDAVVDINTTHYDIVYGDSIELRTDANGSNDDASDLTMLLTFVYA